MDTTEAMGSDKGKGTAWAWTGLDLDDGIDDGIDAALDDIADEIPAPRRVDVPPTTLQQGALLVLAAVGAVVLAASFALDRPHAGIVRLFGAFLVVHALVVAASWLPPGVLSARVDRFLDNWVGSVSSGFYGLVALASFGLAEAADLADDIAAFDLASFGVTQWLIPWLIGFSIDSVMNMVWAAMWPMQLASEHGTRSAAVFAALAWGVFWLGTRVFPVAPLAAKPKAGADEDEDAAK